jgi:excisionase family DNA binding protein
MAQEILTPEEFAQRLKIGRSTLFEWIRNGVLVPDKHFVKVGRILRFSWSDDVLFSLEKPKTQTKQTKNVRRQQSKVNWDY